jgi:hypothetical protein
MNNNFDKIDKATLDAAKRGDTEAVISSLSEADRRKVEETLADKEKLRQILSSDAAQKLIKILGGDKKNG